MRFRIVPLELKELNALVSRLHRHHKPVQGHRFSIGLMEHDKLVGGCSVGRPVARMTNAKEVLEVTRLVTDGTPHACSALYSAAARVGKELGYLRIQTFILDSEPGTSLKAAGWMLDGLSDGGQWVQTAYLARGGGRKHRTDQPTCPKQRWIKVLNVIPKCGL